MLGKNHVVTGVSGWILLNEYILPTAPSDFEYAIQLVIVVFASLISDIDHPDSILGRRFKFISVPLSYMQGDRSILSLPWSESTHSRGITHSLIPVIGCYWISVQFPTFGTPLLFGISAHITMDYATLAGVRLLWPMPIRFRSPLPFATGSVWEYLISGSMLVAAILEVTGVPLINVIDAVKAL